MRRFWLSRPNSITSQQYAPEMIPFCEGMAAGATASGYPMDYAEALARQTSIRTFPGTEPPGSGVQTLPPSGLLLVLGGLGQGDHGRPTHRRQVQR